MNKVFAIIPVIAIAGVAAFALSPYFTESSIDEALPTGAIMQPIKESTAVMQRSDGPIMEERTTEKAMAEETIPMTYAGKFIGVGDGIHDAQGDAYTIPLEDGSSVLRLENFRSTNGPDLYVYLATDDAASDFVSLGGLKANKGNQNYEIPEGTDLTRYNKVLIWCKAFGVLFGSAQVLPQT